VTVSAWQLREQELTLKFSLGRPQVGANFTLAAVKECNMC
jgi:hypothetical protein